MRRTVLRHRWVMALVALLVAGAAGSVGWLVETSSAQSSPLPERCDTSICQTATGPVTLLPAVQRLRFNVHNTDQTEALVTMVVIDLKTGEVLAKHQEVLKAFTGTSFEPDLAERDLPAIQVVGGVRVSRLKGAQNGGFGASLEIVDAETGRTAHVLPFIGGTRGQGGINWGAQANWSPEAAFNNW